MEVIRIERELWASITNKMWLRERAWKSLMNSTRTQQSSCLRKLVQGHLPNRSCLQKEPSSSGHRRLCNNGPCFRTAYLNSFPAFKSSPSTLASLDVHWCSTECVLQFSAIACQVCFAELVSVVHLEQQARPHRTMGRNVLDLFVPLTIHLSS